MVGQFIADSSLPGRVRPGRGLLQHCTFAFLALPVWKAPAGRFAVMAIFMAVTCGGAQASHPRETAKLAELRFHALLNRGDTWQRPEFVFILGKPSLALTETQSELP
jgi:hypothetical protein